VKRIDVISAPAFTAESGSFRDREGRIYRCDGRIFRGLSQTALANFRQLESTSFYRSFQATGALVASRECRAQDAPLPPAVRERWAGFLEHQPITVISYPYEWTFGMLRDAALLQLDLLEAAIVEDMSCKDATPYNIQFAGGKPVFIDIASFIPLESGATWAGYRQFCEMFLFPLMLQAYKGIHFQPFMRAAIDGIDVQTAARLFSLRDRFRPGVFSHVWLQSKFDRRYGGTQQNVRSNIKSAGFNREMILANVRRIRKLVTGMKWQGDGSEWAAYAEFHNYSAADHELKESFIADCAAESQPRVAWDIGCNTGQFAKIAAQHSGLVVAMDLDHFAVERLYRELKAAGGGNILPLVQNVADPSPNWGWQNRERSELKMRAAPDLVLCLALLHHVVITANIPLDEFIAWLARLTPDLVIEYVSRADDKVKTLLRNKDDDYADYSREGLEKALQQHFNIVRQLTLGQGRRHLYWCRPPLQPG
jgi:SAM-dependent methyltransferase